MGFDAQLLVEFSILLGQILIVFCDGIDLFIFLGDILSLLLDFVLP
jgi:hypothetical protein